MIVAMQQHVNQHAEVCGALMAMSHCLKTWLDSESEDEAYRRADESILQAVADINRICNECDITPGKTMTYDDLRRSLIAHCRRVLEILEGKS